MKLILSLLLLCWSWEAWSQPILRGPYTTNALSLTGTDQQLLFSSNGIPSSVPTLQWDYTNTRFLIGTGLGPRFNLISTPLMYMYAGGNPAASFSRLTMEWSTANQRYEFHSERSGSNAAPVFVGVGTGGWIINTDGTLSYAGTTNKLSIANDTLLLDGVSVGGNPAAPINNFYATNQFFINGKGNTLIITNNITGSQLILTNDLLFAWNVLTMSGSNVSTISLTNGLMHKLLATNNAFIGAPTDFPGTNFGRTFQIHIAQDSVGGRTLMLTNSSWVISGSGVSTNAVPAINTNANSVSILTFATSPFDATKLYGVMTTVP